MKIAIIGAGWAGLGCLRVLKDQGHHIDVYEQKNDVGGTWHPDNNYSGLRIHSPAITIEFPDFPLPSNVDKFERVYSSQVFSYLQAYTKYFDMYRYIQFNTYIKKASFNSNSKKAKLVLIDDKGNEKWSDEYDYVIYTNGRVNKNIPNIKQVNDFTGTIYHSIDVNFEVFNDIILSNKKVTVVGGSKAATDFICQFQSTGYKVNWLYRKPYWFFRYGLRIHWMRDQHKYAITKWIFEIYRKKAKKWPLFTFWLLKTFNIIHIFGKKHLDIKKFHRGIIDDDQMEILRKYSAANGIEGEIDGFGKDYILLKDGRKIKTDVVIFCTGSGPTKVVLDIELDNQKFDFSNIKDVYRARVIPEIPNLIFTVYHIFIFGTVNGLINGNWVAKYITLNPDTKYLQKNATHYDYTFFTKNPFFDSSNNRPTYTGDINNMFLDNNEISRDEYQKLMNNYFYGSKPNQPIDFTLKNKE